jgi:hypothetical protein
VVGIDIGRAFGNKEKPPLSKIGSDTSLEEVKITELECGNVVNELLPLDGSDSLTATAFAVRVQFFL